MLPGVLLLRPRHGVSIVAKLAGAVNISLTGLLTSPKAMQQVEFCNFEAHVQVGNWYLDQSVFS